MKNLEFTILIDGACPLCAKEAAVLRHLDRRRGRLELVDIADPSFDATAFGTTQEAVMGHIHGVVPGQGLVQGMEVFRRAYAAVGLGWLLAPTAWPGLRPLFDWLYNRFASIRLKLPGNRDRCTDRCHL
ncbi:MAG: DUF393 domain-containing protein [Planctomycetota bacterium]